MLNYNTYFLLLQFALVFSIPTPETIPNNTYSQNCYSNNIIPTEQYTRLSLTTASGPPESEINLQYWGGKIISNVKVFIIYWGGSEKVWQSVKIEKFYKGITNSKFMDLLSEYQTPTQKINKGSVVGTFSLTSKASSTIVSDAEIQSTILDLIRQNLIPMADENMYYAIHFAKNITITSPQGYKSCDSAKNHGFCGYHGTARPAAGTNGYHLVYGVHPDFSQGGCSKYCGKSISSLDNLMATASHELAEAITDPMVGVSFVGSSTLGWYDNKFGEVTDICSAQQFYFRGGDGELYRAQKQWSNAKRECVGVEPENFWRRISDWWERIWN